MNLNLGVSLWVRGKDTEEPILKLGHKSAAVCCVLMGPYPGEEGALAGVPGKTVPHSSSSSPAIRQSCSHPANLSLQAMKQEQVMVPQMVLINLPLGAPLPGPGISHSHRVPVLSSVFLGGV